VELSASSFRFEHASAHGDEARLLRSEDLAWRFSVRAEASNETQNRDRACTWPKVVANAEKRRLLWPFPESWGFLLHRLWVTGEVYEPLRNHNLRQERKKIAA
jgi:hypothetical protein